MSRRDKNMAYGIIAVGLIVLVVALTCMLLNKKDSFCSTKKSSLVKWPWVPDDFNGPIYIFYTFNLINNFFNNPQLKKYRYR